MPKTSPPYGDRGQPRHLPKEQVARAHGKYTNAPVPIAISVLIQTRLPQKKRHGKCAPQSSEFLRWVDMRRQPLACNKKKLMCMHGYVQKICCTTVCVKSHLSYKKCVTYAHGLPIVNKYPSFEIAQGELN